MSKRITILMICLSWLFVMAGFAQGKSPALSGKIISNDKEAVPYATLLLKGTGHGCVTDEQGMYFLYAPPGRYTLVVSAIGYETVERPVTLTRERQKMHIILRDSQVGAAYVWQEPLQVAIALRQTIPVPPPGFSSETSISIA